jgi:hypothetical protein
VEFVFAVDPQLLSIDDEVPNSTQTSDAAITRADSYENFETTQEDNGAWMLVNGRKEAGEQGRRGGRERRLSGYLADIYYAMHAWGAGPTKTRLTCLSSRRQRCGRRFYAATSALSC